MYIRTFEDRAALVRAYRRLEHRGVASKVSAAVGARVDVAVKLLPSRYSQYVQRMAETAITRTLQAGISALPRERKLLDKDGFNSILGSVCGAASGMFGLTGLAAELPLMVTIILRSVAGIARQEGEDLDMLEAQAACISVLALGGRYLGQNTANTDYFSVRLALSDALCDGSTGFGLHTVPANAMVRLVPLVGVRFGAAVSHKIPSQSVPLVGALSGATINAILMRHYQQMAHGHFAIRRLERKYGAQVVMHEYEGLNSSG